MASTQLEAEVELDPSLTVKRCLVRTESRIEVVVHWDSDGPPKLANNVACNIEILLNGRNRDEARVYIFVEPGIRIKPRFIEDLQRTYGLSEATTVVVRRDNVIRMGTSQL